MLISQEIVLILIPLAQTTQRLSNILFDSWPHQLTVISSKLSENGNSGISDTIAEIKLPLKEVKRLLPIATGFVVNQWGRSQPHLDQQIRDDSVLLLNNWKRLVKVSGIVARLLESSEGEFKRLSNNVAKKLRQVVEMKEITEFLEEYCKAVGATEVLAEDTLDKIEKMSAGFEKVSGG
jgi:hypothetical protein